VLRMATFPCVTIEPVSEVPIYQQLATILRDQIRDGRLQPGQILPSEQTLMQEHEISRDTVRKSVRLLVEEGLVVRVQGKGSFVRR
jgi:DNA-binding GntR family transcriptional regulator